MSEEVAGREVSEEVAGLQVQNQTPGNVASYVLWVTGENSSR